jgi:flagellar L-ring protein precursor FlgH
MKNIFSIIFILAGVHILSAQSLYTDIKAHEVGDVLSVVIVENANASRESSSKSKSKSDMNVDASANGNIASFLPIFGGGSSLSSSYDGGDGTEQRERLSGRITVRITEKTSGGMYKVEGERTLNVNGEENLMELTGVVRPRDISTNNSVFSYNVADAEIIYKKGGITNMVNDGFFGNLFVKIVGLAMVASSLGYLALK